MKNKVILFLLTVNALPCDDVIDLALSLNMNNANAIKFNLITSSCCSTSGNGITCNAGAIEKINWSGYGLNGVYDASKVPTTLKEFNIAANAITGSIANLPNGLIKFIAGGNQLSGSIPTLPSGLLELDLFNNLLSNGIPTLPSTLGILNVGMNQLTGTFPTIPNTLTKLVANTNRMSGNISLITFPSGLNYVQLSENEFTGTLTIGYPQKLYIAETKINNLAINYKGGLNDCSLDYTPLLGSTSLTGLSVCSKIALYPLDDCNKVIAFAQGLKIQGSPSKMAILKKSCCSAITNSGPSKVSISCNETHVTGIEMFGHHLGGTIDFANMPNGVKSFDISNNDATGSISSIPSHLESFSAYNNLLSGTIPELPTTLTSFDVRNNRLNGTLPTLPDGLVQILTHDNLITGQLPATLPDSLVLLFISGNLMNGPLPTFPQDISSILIANNKFTGDLIADHPQAVNIANNLITNVIIANPLSQFENGNCDLSNNPMYGASGLATFDDHSECLKNNLYSLDCAQVKDLALGFEMNIYNPSKYNSILNNCCELGTGVTCSNTFVVAIEWEGFSLRGNFDPNHLPVTVLTLNLYNNNIGGSISSFPSNLTSIHIGKNQFSDEIPSLPSGLTSFSADQNQFTNDVPTLIGCLHLLDFNLAKNLLTGPIPTLPDNLESLNLAENDLDGTIPTLPNSLTELLLNNNQLTGSITSFPSTLTKINLSHNQLSSSFPSTLPPSLTDLNIAVNGFTGNLPALTSFITHYIANDNLFSNGIPILTNSPNLFDFDVSKNDLNGIIPTLPDSLSSLRLADNLLTGQLPMTLPPLLTELNVAGNTMDGALPIFPDSMTKIAIEGNQFSGTLQALQPLELSIQGNLLTNVVITHLPPAYSVCNLSNNPMYDASGLDKFVSHSECVQTNLYSLDCAKVKDLALGFNMDTLNVVKYNSIANNCCQANTGVTCSNTFVVAINWEGFGLGGSFNAVNVPPTTTLLNLNDNAIGGSIASFPSSLTVINFGKNQLNGTIPTLENCSGLTELNLSKNQFIGAIPTLPNSLRTLNLSENSLNSIPLLTKSLTTLLLNNNELTGTIDELPDSLTVINLANNHLSGSLPELHEGLVELNISSNLFSGSLPDVFSTTSKYIVSDNLFTNLPNIYPPSFVVCEINRNPIADSANIYSFKDANCVFKGIYLPKSNDCTSVQSFADSLNMDLVNPSKFSLISSNCCKRNTGVYCTNGLVTKIVWSELGLDGVLDMSSMPPNVVHLDLGLNILTGSITTIPLGLDTLVLHDNQLTGTLPSLITNTNLKTLVVHKNQFTSTLPPLPSSLVHLNVCGNQLSGTVPTLPDGLKYLYLGYPGLTGNSFSGQLTIKNPSILYINHNSIDFVTINDDSKLWDCDIRSNPLQGNQNALKCLKE